MAQSSPTSTPSRAAKQYARHQRLYATGRCDCASCVTYRVDHDLADDTDREKRAQWDTLRPPRATARTTS